MSKKYFLILVLLIIILFPVSSLPESYADETTGWFSVLVSYDYIFPENKGFWCIDLMFFGEDLTWVANPEIGFGMTIGMNEESFIFTINTLYMLHFSDSIDIYFPLKVRAGVDIFSETYYFGTVSSGLEAFLGKWTGFHEYDLEEEVCINLAAGGGVLFRDFLIQPFMESAIGFSTANAYYPSSGYYYY
jgi:hypothetical protein